MKWTIFLILALTAGCSQIGTSSGAMILQDDSGSYHRYILSESYYEGQVVIESYCLSHETYETIIIGRGYEWIEQKRN